jgi:putative ATP-binding cassette transporter
MGHVLKVIRFVLGVSGEVPYARLIMVLVGLTGLVSGVATTGMIMMINRALTANDADLADFAWIFALLVVTLPLFRFFSQYMLVRLTSRTLYGLRLRWCRRILGLPLRELEKIGPPRLLASLTNDIGAVTEALSFLPLLFMHFAVIMTCLLYLGWLSKVLLLGLLGFMVVGILSYQIPLIRGMVYQRLARQQWNNLFHHIEGVTKGAKELKMHQPRREAMIEENIEPTADTFRRHVNSASTIFAAAASWGQSLFFVAIGLLIFVVPRFHEVGPAVLSGYIITLIQMMTPLEVLLTSLPRLTNASVAIDMIEKLGVTLQKESKESAAVKALGPASTWERLELRAVKHNFRGETEHENFLLGPIDLVFEPGELTFIVGGNGSGKTTLAKLLLGLYAPQEGEILFDGQPVTDESRDAYRQHFATVFSDFFLFDTLLGLEDPSLDEAAQKYLKELQLSHKVKIEGGALSTTDLSQGQRKRLALLTAFLEDRPIYLFDEWAADQDPFFKDVFYRQLLPELKARGKTILVISHDDHYYDLADRIIKLEYGQLQFDRSREEFLSEAKSEKLLVGSGDESAAQEVRGGG